ncbi:MAG: glycosyltransferase [Snowella sp.]|nr:glycosyltransferase [Snowella sp.]
MNKFIIIDHSLCSLQGHHYECSVSVAEAAARLGYQPVTVANRAFPESLYPEGIKTLSVFERDWFDQPTVTPSLSKFQQLLLTLNDFFGDRSFENWSQELVEFKNYYFLKWRITQPKLSLFLEKVEGSTSRLIDWINQDIQLLRSIPLSNTVWGILKIIWGLIRFGFKIILKILNRFWQKLITIPEAKSFSDSLKNTLKELNLTPEDHILIHTLSIEQLEAIYHLLESWDINNLPQFHILLRRDTEDPLVLNAQGMGLKSCLNTFYEKQFWPEKIRFYTDTEDLVSRHNELSPIQLIQVAIPFRQEKLRDHATQNNEVLENINKPIHLVYLGDARSEKGYHHLPSLIENLWTDYLEPEKIKFTIQSNFNINGGESVVLDAKLKLEQYPSRNVQLIQEAMLPDEYYQLLNSADLVILPYNPESYQRTSGVLTEALAAGKPVVVPENSWLAQQVDESRAVIFESPETLASSVIQAINNLDELTKAANAYKLEWRVKQSPDTFVKCLLEKPDFSPQNTSALNKNLDNAQETQEAFNLIKSDQNILIILEIQKILKQQELALLSETIINYLFQCSYAVYGIFYLNPRKYQEQDLDLFSQKIRIIIDQFNFAKYWLLDSLTDIQIPSQINAQDYIDDLYCHRTSLIRDLVELNSFPTSEDLKQSLSAISINTIFLNEIPAIALIEKLGLSQISKIVEVNSLQSFDYALQNKRDRDLNELALETNLLNQCQVLITPEQKLAEKLRELTNQPTVYAYLGNQKNSQPSKQYYATLNNVFTDIFGDRALTLNNLNQTQKIAVLFPWADILERKSGASQRVGLLLDYLRSQNYDVACFSIGDRKPFWHSDIYYDYFQPRFEQANLVQGIYEDAYESWRSSVDLITEQLSEKIEITDQNNPETNWIPWIYYQFRFDPAFHEWIEKITNWADVVILEYPFWAKIVGKICQNKEIPLILTAHDVLSQKLDENSVLGKIALAEEIEALKQANEVVTLSEPDQRFFQQYGVNSHCVPIGIDTQKISQFCLNEPNIKNPEDLETLAQLPADFCLFVGSRHQPNIEAVQQIRHWVAEAELKGQPFNYDFAIAGGCWEQESLKNFQSLGKVSDEVLNYLYQNAALIVSPLKAGTGMSVKIIEAMAYGKVILGTTVSFRGYPVESGVNCIICDTVENYPDVIRDLLKDPARLKSIGKNAQIFAQNYDYRRLYQTYLDLIT